MLEESIFNMLEKNLADFFPLVWGFNVYWVAHLIVIIRPYLIIKTKKVIHEIAPETIIKLDQLEVCKK